MAKKNKAPTQKNPPAPAKPRVLTLEERFPLPSVQEMADDPEKLELLLYAIRERESKHGDFLKKGLTSPNAKGAVGTMQIIPRFYDKSSGRAPGYGLIPLRKDATPEQVETYGRYVYGHMLEMYGNPIDASVAYNMGPAKTNAWIKKGRKWNELPSETRKYIPEISSIYAREKALPPEQRMPRGKVLNLPKNDIFPPIPPPPPAPPVVLDRSKAGMAMHREEQLEGRAEPGYLTTLQAEDAVESRATPGILSAARGSGPALLDLARQLLRRRAEEGAPSAPVGEGYEEVPVPRFQDGGEVDLSTSAAGGSGPTEEERQGLGSLADRARNMFSVEGAQNTARYALGQGLGMGWGDEAEAWARSKVTGRSYEDELAEIRAKNKAYEERNPIGSTVADVAGGLIPTAAALALTPVTGGSTAPAALGSLGRMYGLIQKIPSVRHGAAIGATQGAVTGAGVADDDFSREEGAAIGGVLGGTIGAAVPYAAEKLLGVSNRKALLEAASKVPDDTAYDPLRQRLVDEGVISQAVKPKGGNWSDAADIGGVQSLLSSLRPIRNPREDSPYPKVWSMDPRQKAALASAKVQAESPWLKTLFGVTREDLYETSLRKGNRPGQWDDVPNPRGSETAAQVMTPQNAQRLVDELVEAEKYPEMFRSMHAWYVMDPAYRRLRELMPEEEANRAFARLNSFMAAASPMSEPTTEIPRGLAANVLDNRGLFELFQQYGGKPAQGRAAQFLQDRLGASDEDMRGFVALTEEIPLGKFPGHSAHINQAGMMARMGGNDYRLTGKQPKVVLYSQASGVPDHPHGFQTDSFIPDAGMTRSIGVSDATRANTPGAAMDVATYRDLRPWWREKVAGAAGLEAVPAQAINWASSSPATGIGTSLGASKLELLANYIGRRAIETGEDPFKLRDMILMGRGFADGGEVRNGVGSLASVARGMMRRAS